MPIHQRCRARVVSFQRRWSSCCVSLSYTIQRHDSEAQQVNPNAATQNWQHELHSSVVRSLECAVVGACSQTKATSATLSWAPLPFDSPLPSPPVPSSPRLPDRLGALQLELLLLHGSWMLLPGSDSLLAGDPKGHDGPAGVLLSAVGAEHWRVSRLLA